MFDFEQKKFVPYAQQKAKQQASVGKPSLMQKAKSVAFNTVANVAGPAGALASRVLSTEKKAGAVDAVGRLARDTAQASPRAILSTSMSVAPKSAREERGEFTPRNKVERAVFGSEPVKPIGQRINEADEKIKPFAERYGAGSLSKPFAGAAVVGMTALDLNPLSGFEKKAAKKTPGAIKAAVDVVKEKIPASVRGIMRTYADMKTGKHLDLNKTLELEDDAARIAKDFNITPKKSEGLEDAFRRTTDQYDTERKVLQSPETKFARDKVGRFAFKAKPGQTLFKDGTPFEAYGAAAGVQADENGEVTIDPKAAALGVLGIGATRRIGSKATGAAFNGFNDLSLKTLEKLKGKSTVSRQFIEDLSNQPDLKQGERDVIRKVLADMDTADPLVEEAGKYKSAEEFADSFETLYHGTPYKFDEFQKNKVTFFTPDRSFAENYGSDKSFARAMDAEVRVLERKGKLNLFDSKNPEHIKKIEKLIPDEVEIMGPMLGFGGKVPKSEFIERLTGVFTHNTPKFAQQAKKVGEIFEDMSIKHSGEWRIKEIKPNSVVAEKISKWHPGKVFETQEFPRSGTYKTTGEPYWKDFEGDEAFIEAVRKSGFDGFKMTERGKATYGVFDTSKLLTKEQLTSLYNKARGGSTISVPDFANKVKAELLPLERKNVGDQYENISLSDDLRGRVKNYTEHVYESPIKTSAGGVHYGADESPGYFGHTRVEDMADKQTRRVIEVQSDLYQKGRLENEGPEGFDFAYQATGASPDTQNSIVRSFVTPEMKAKRAEEITKLSAYNDPTAHFRMIREEVKKAAQDGKTKLQFPTGETAMKIEGLGQDSAWASRRPNGWSRSTIDDLKVGAEIRDDRGGMSHWIITDVLGDGKFKAVPKESLTRALDENGTNTNVLSLTDQLYYAERHLPEVFNNSETFDISGKVDTENPIYRFYEKEVGKYLKNKYGATLVTDPQGVKWWEVPVKKEWKDMPVEAFAGVPMGFEEDKDGDGKPDFNPYKAGAFALGMAGAGKLGKGSLDNMRLQIDNLKEVLGNHPARLLSKYANKFGEIGEVTGGAATKFRNQGDDIVTQMGFSDSESARVAYQDYLKGKKRLADMEEAYKAEREYRRNVLLTDKVQLGKQRAEDIMILNKAPKIVKESPVGQFERARIQNPKTYEHAKPIEKMVVEVPNTPYQKKIGLIDYVRTPERVFEKIGMGEQFKSLRTQYDKYLKELPVEIDKVTAWSKRVPEGANERIFDFLDGKIDGTQLSPTEVKVAGEIRDYLKVWAEKLGLPKDRQISHYITHLFDNELASKEFPDELAKIIGDKVPGSVYDPFLQQRLGARGYKRDTWAALDAYVKRGVRKYNMDPALEKMKQEADYLEKSQLNYVKKFVDRVNMRPTDLDNLLDTTIKNLVGYKYGPRPTAVGSRKLRRAGYRALLGLNPASAIRNLSQGANTYAKLGEKYTMLGYMDVFKNIGSKELEEVGVLNADFIEDRTIDATKKFWEKADKVLFAMFETAERVNRGAAYYGAKRKALNAGLSKEKAIEYGKKIVRDTQFTFGSIDTPAILQSDLAKIAGQFQTYSLKQTEFLAEMAKNKDFLGLARYTGATLAFAYTIGQFIGMDYKSLIPTFRFGLPPAAEFPKSVYQSTVSGEDDFGNEMDATDRIKNVGDSAFNYIPAGGQMRKSYKGLTSDEEGTRKIRASIFGKSSLPDKPKSAYQLAQQKKTEEKNAYKERIRPVYDKAQMLGKQGREEEAQALVDSLSDADYEIYKSIKQSEKTKRTNELKEAIYPRFVQIQQLGKAGNVAEAQALVEAMTDEEYHAYELLKDAAE